MLYDPGPKKWAEETSLSESFDQAVRTHDQLYLTENRYEQPKEIFRIAAAIVRSAGLGGRGHRLVDIGCAAGEFAYFLKKEFPEADVAGYDLLPELIDKARTQVPGVQFAVGSVLEPTLLEQGSADVTFLIGVHSIFDDPTDCFRNLIRWTKPGGLVIVLGLFNKFDIDVWVRYRPAGKPDGAKELGWNLVSRSSARRIVAEADSRASVEFHPVVMPLDLPRNASDPVRSWTEKRADGERFLTNGLSLIINLETMVVRRQ
jgi:SAM-dependent methyltransferase